MQTENITSNAHPRSKRHFLRGHTLLGPLTPGDQVLDLGANEGEFARAIIAEFGVSCTSFEPNPRLRERMDVVEGMVLRPEAIGGMSGMSSFVIDPENSEASSLVATRPGNQNVQVVEQVNVLALDDLIQSCTEGGRRIALVKLDIEGAEDAALRQTPAERLKRVDQFTIEFHDHNQMLSLVQVQELLQILRDAGFVVIKWSTFGHGDVLAYQPSRCEVSRLYLLASLLKHRYLSGIKRRILRKL